MINICYYFVVLLKSYMLCILDHTIVVSQGLKWHFREISLPREEGSFLPLSPFIL